MLRPAITQIITKNESYYSLVIGVAKRAREIADELCEKNEVLKEKPVKTAVEEFASGKYKIVEYSEPETEKETVY
ncbi:MAG: DNA-directed RNA polymerase subunit omega [Oscillospiraceae bacterium]|nr:DNA-directed RNA polymerase subunit omega [Oscillospiraceae bacterium]